MEVNEAGLNENSLKEILGNLGVSSVYGDPVKRGDISIIPVAETKIGLGFGSGRGSHGEGMEKESRKKSAGMEENRKKLDRDRQKLKTEINKRSLSIYEKIRQRKPRAIVDAIDGICQGCHMMLPPQTYNILLRGDRMIQCPNCHRIVYCTEKEACSKD